MKLNKILFAFALLIISIVSITAVQAVDDYAITSFSADQAMYDIGDTATFAVTIENKGSILLETKRSTGDIGPAPNPVGDLIINFGDGTSVTMEYNATRVGVTQTFYATHTYSTYENVTSIATIVPLSNLDTPFNNLKTLNLQIVDSTVYAVPVIEEITDKVLVINDVWTYQISAEAEAGIATYSTSLAGMTISSTGLISYTANTLGTFPVIITVTDNNGQTDTESFTITVREDAGEISLSPESITIGGENAVRGNQYTTEVTITNTGTQTLTNFALDLTKIGGTEISSDVIYVSALPTSLTPGSTHVLTFTGTIPTTTDGGQAELYGYFTITADSADGSLTTGNKNIYFEAESSLEIDEVELYVNNHKEETLTDGETFDEFKEGDEIKLTVKVENNFDFDIEDVYVELFADNSDWDFVEGESNEVDIDEGDDDTFELVFDIDPKGLDEDSEDGVTITIVVKGDATESNYQHYATMTFTLEIDREKDEITITDVTVSRTTFSCTGGQLEINVDFKNTGSNDQDTSSIIVDSDDLNFREEYEIEEDFESKDDDYTNFYITIPSGLESGSYFIDIKAYNEDNDVTDTKTVEIQVSCGDEDVPVTTDPNTQIEIQPINPTNNFGEFVQGQSSFRNSALYVVLLIVLAILVVAGIIMLAAIAVKKN